MYWTNDYEELSTEFRTSNEAQKEIILRAYDKARHFFDSKEHDMDDFIVIRVEGYSCIALITDDFSPIEISSFVFPYDQKRIFPLQQIEQKIMFSTN